MQNNRYYNQFKAFATRILDIRQEKENEQEIIESIRKGVERISGS